MASGPTKFLVDFRVNQHRVPDALAGRMVVSWVLIQGLSDPHARVVGGGDQCHVVCFDSLAVAGFHQFVLGWLAVCMVDCAQRPFAASGAGSHDPQRPDLRVLFVVLTLLCLVLQATGGKKVSQHLTTGGGFHPTLCVDPMVVVVSL